MILVKEIGTNITKGRKGRKESSIHKKRFQNHPFQQKKTSMAIFKMLVNLLKD